MRNPERIERTLFRIGLLWKENPDLRLGQLLISAVNPSAPCPELFYIEEENLIKKLCESQRPKEYEDILSKDVQKRLVFLNKLNRLLTKKEKEFYDRAMESVCLYQEKKKSDPFTTDYEVLVDVQYYLPKEEDPVYVFHHQMLLPADAFNECPFFRNEKINWETGNLEKIDWRESYMPVLDEPYCYLLHDLIDHTRLGAKIFKINMIRIDIQIWDQNCMKLKKNKWLVEKRD